MTTNQGVFLVGGRDKNEDKCEEIIQLYCQDDIIENCQYQEIEQKLKIPRKPIEFNGLGDSRSRAKIKIT